jgi:hypothetical protein
LEEARGDAGLTEHRLRSDDPRNDGLFVIDGGVLEAFGFGRDEARRIHLSLVDTVELVEKGETYLKVEGGSPGVQQLAQAVDPAEPALAELVNDLQGKAGGA